MPRLRLKGLLLPLALASLSGCSGTPFGDQLSRSFSQPPAAPPNAAPATKPSTARQEATAAKPASKPAVTSAAAAPAPAAPSTPAPYRVTIKLPAADPSSPAEAVTDALRAAGVAFEVETIERVPAAGDAAISPVRSPAPPAR